MSAYLNTSKKRKNRKKRGNANHSNVMLDLLELKHNWLWNNIFVKLGLSIWRNYHSINLKTLWKTEETSIWTFELPAKIQTQDLLNKEWYPLYHYIWSQKVMKQLYRSGTSFDENCLVKQNLLLSFHPWIKIHHITLSLLWRLAYDLVLSSGFVQGL
jgi:hypothetical protein